jgi:hypothetical protein
MRQVLHLLLALLVLRMFFPELTVVLEETLLAFLTFTRDTFASPGAPF